MSDLAKSFWYFLNNVRGRKEVRELRDIVLSLIFLKHANDSFFSGKSDIISVPKISQWSYLTNKLDDILLLEDNEFYSFLYDALLSIEDKNDQIRYTFRYLSLNNFNQSDFKLIKNLFIKISELDLINENVPFSSFIGDLLSKFSEYQGKKGGDTTTPNSVSQLMVKLIDLKEGSVLDSTCGTGGFFDEIKEQHQNNIFQFYGQEYNKITLAIAKLRFAFNVTDKINFCAEDTLKQDCFPGLKVDYVLMHPPFDLRLSDNRISQYDPRFEFGHSKIDASMVWLQHAIFHLNDQGRSAVLLSNRALYSQGIDLEIRKNIIETDVVESIISLPPQLFSNTSIPASIWLLNKKKSKKNKVLFVDASNIGMMINKSQRFIDKKEVLEISDLLNSWQVDDLNYNDKVGFNKSVDISEIIDMDYTLTPSRYVGIEALSKIDLSRAIKFGDILEYIRPSKLEADVNYKRITIKDLSSNPDSYILDSNSLKIGELTREFKCLHDNVLLISKVGNKLKPTYFEGVSGKYAFPSSSIYSFKVDLNQVRIDYLIAELDKDYIKAQVDNMRKGSGIPFINRKDLENILIIIPPSVEQQKEILEKERHTRFQSAAKHLGFEKEIEKLKKAQLKDLGSKKHNIMQHLNNVKASADVLIHMMHNNDGVLRVEDIIDPRRGVTVEKRFFRLQESLDKVIYYVDNITNDLKFDEAEIINIVEFIDECKERGVQNKLFSVDIIIDSETLIDKAPLIYISKNDFEEIYNNLLENSIKHGFIDQNKKYVFRVTISLTDNFIKINFENNGKPFPVGIADSILVKGEKAGVTGGTGIGLWKVSEIAKHFKVKLKVFDEPVNDFPVGFEFLFKLERQSDE